ncbi:UDP-glucose 4-epimerase [Methyloligella halotolerans]|uniref:UDP-glucose 4-epimerase n=1 Tax=Methyloligella halotolerans TaxID=1177755 RepID=A0A1E2S2J6_9HYPH|nr:NAD-dependent epimerase/dehydratase family protein [Methyloligella halotolerans]ODA68664.1 UDP-glucose 4-epimerase [Methyloligella halotolerans]
MRLLVTGGAGFVGTNLIHYLSERGGFEICALDNESLGRRENLAPYDIEFVKGDIRDVDALDRVLPGKDAIVHLAADTRVIDSIENPDENFDVNVLGTFRLLQAARRHGVGRIVNASTGGAILGEAPPPVHEEMVARPSSPYGASKLAVEGYLSAFSESYGLAATSLRFSNIYGPRSFHKGSVVAHFIKQILAGKPLVVYGDGSQVRDYLYTGDLMDGIHAALTAEKSGVFQLGSGKPTTLNELIGVLKEVSGEPDLQVRYEDFRAGEIHTTWCDIGKARRELGFSADTGLKDGVTATWAWFREQTGES